MQSAGGSNDRRRKLGTDSLASYTVEEPEDPSQSSDIPGENSRNRRRRRALTGGCIVYCVNSRISVFISCSPEYDFFICDWGRCYSALASNELRELTVSTRPIHSHQTISNTWVILYGLTAEFARASDIAFPNDIVFE